MELFKNCTRTMAYNGQRVAGKRLRTRAKKMKIAIIYNTMKDVSSRAALMRSLIKRGNTVVAIAPFDGHEELVRALGVDCIDVKISRWGTLPWSEIAVVLKLWRLLRREQPDAVLLYTIKPIIYGAIGARMAGVRRIVSVVTGLGYMFVEGAKLSRAKRTLATMLYRFAFRFNERVLFQNQDDLEYFKEKNAVSSEKIVRIRGSGVDTGYFSPREDMAEEARFLLVSRMLWTKGIGLYVAAARRLKSKYPHAQFSILGPIDDNPAAIPSEILARWHGEGAIEYVGATDDVRSYLARCSVYVLPSFYREGIPRTNLEALAMGKPVITTDVPGCRETVLDGENGILIPPRNEDALVNAMETFLKDPAIAVKMGEISRKLAVDSFRSETVNQTIMNAIEGKPV